MMSVMTCTGRNLIESAFSICELMKLPIMNKLETILYIRQNVHSTFTFQLFL